MSFGVSCQALAHQWSRHHRQYRAMSSDACAPRYECARPCMNTRALCRLFRLLRLHQRLFAASVHLQLHLPPPGLCLPPGRHIVSCLHALPQLLSRLGAPRPSYSVPMEVLCPILPCFAGCMMYCILYLPLLLVSCTSHCSLCPAPPTARWLHQQGRGIAS